MKKLVIWTTVAILIPAVLFALSACMKAPSTDVEKGPEVACDALDQSISSIQFPSVQAIKRCEYAAIDSTTILENQYPGELTQQYAVTVMDRQEDTTMIKLTIQETTVEKNSSGQFSKPTTKEGDSYILKSSGSSTSSVASTKSFLSDIATQDLGVRKIANDYRISSASGSGANCKLQQSGAVKSFNKLEITDKAVPIPPYVQSSANCGGLKDCSSPLQGKLMKFDRWIPDPNDATKEMKLTTYLTTVSGVPYFAAILQQCVQYSWPYQGQQVLVTACDDVKNFRFGVNTAYNPQDPATACPSTQ